MVNKVRTIQEIKATMDYFKSEINRLEEELMWVPASCQSMIQKQLDNANDQYVYAVSDYIHALSNN